MQSRGSHGKNYNPLIVCIEGNDVNCRSLIFLTAWEKLAVNCMGCHDSVETTVGRTAGQMILQRYRRSNLQEQGKY